MRPKKAYAILLGLLTASCGASVVSTADDSLASEPLHDGRLAPTRPRSVATHPVERLRLTFHGVRASDGAALDAAAVLDELSTADVICVAEDHDRAEHHWAELAILYGLLRRATTAGRQVAIGMEMFPTTAQEALDQYLQQPSSTEQELLSQTGWRHRPGHDYDLYRPLVLAAREHHLDILALNAPRKVTRKVARSGLGALTEEERKDLPELNLNDEQHRELFDAATRDHPRSGKADNLYAAQVVWDETMAETAASWLQERQPARQLLLLAGAHHCRAPAIPARLQRRVPCHLVSVRPVLEHTGEDVQQVLMQYDYALVLSSAE
jgi:uncharacterized iron-regulated protein